MIDPITPQRLAELREHYDRGADDALECLLELMATGHDGWLTKGRAPWTQSLKAYQADHVALLAEVERLQAELDARPQGLYENWAVGYTDPFGDQHHVQYGAESARGGAAAAVAVGLGHRLSGTGRGGRPAVSGRPGPLQWEPTRRGGLRRTGVAQTESTAQMKQGSVARNHPPVLIKLAEKLGLPECPYVIRWRLETPLGSLRLHHWLGPDDDRAFHDHPWWFVTLVLHGGYTDFSPNGDEHLRPGSVRYRRALHRHTVVPDPGGAWTLLLTGRPLRPWGFWLDGRFRKANKWFLAYGHHPCDSGADEPGDGDLR